MAEIGICLGLLVFGWSALLTPYLCFNYCYPVNGQDGQDTDDLPPLREPIEGYDYQPMQHHHTLFSIGEDSDEEEIRPKSNSDFSIISNAEIEEMNR